MKIVPANATARPPRAPVIASNTYNYCKATLAASARVSVADEGARKLAERARCK